MAKPSKRQNAAAEMIDRQRQYPASEAVTLLKKLATTKFTESVEIAVNLGINARNTDQNIRGSTVLPHGTGKVKRVAVFASGTQADAAKAAGADIVGLDDLAATVQKGEIDFDVCIAARDAMPVVGRLGRILGPRGLMPNPRSGTVVDDVAPAIKDAKSGQLQYRSDRQGVVHGAIGVVSQDEKELVENASAVLAELKRVKPAASKGTYVKKITLSTTMGPGLRIEESSLGVA